MKIQATYCYLDPLGSNRLTAWLKGRLNIQTLLIDVTGNSGGTAPYLAGRSVSLPLLIQRHRLSGCGHPVELYCPEPWALDGLDELSGSVEIIVAPDLLN